MQKIRLQEFLSLFERVARKIQFQTEALPWPEFAGRIGRQSDTGRRPRPAVAINASRAVIFFP